jgi:hypothetical protein
MNFHTWLNNKCNLHTEAEGLGRELPEKLQNTIKQLTPHNEFLYLIMPKGINVGTFEMNGEQLLKWHNQFINQAKQLKDNYKVDGSYKKPMVVDILKKAKEFSDAFHEFFNSKMFDTKDLYVVKS